MKGKLVVASNTWLQVERVSDIWMQVTEVKGLPSVKVGDMVRRSNRGYEAYRSLDATAPVSLLPTRTSYVNLHMTEENYIPNMEKMEGEE